MTPSGTPTSTEIASEQKINVSVAGRRWMMSSVTGRLEKALSPKSRRSHLLDIDDELLPDRPVEPVLLAQALDLLGRRDSPAMAPAGSDGTDVDQQEGDDQQPEQRRHDERAAPQDEARASSAFRA